MYSKYYTEFKRKGQKSPQVDLLAELERRNKEQSQQQGSNNLSNMKSLYDKFAGSPAAAPTGSLYPATTGAAPALQQAGMAPYAEMSTPAIMNGAPYAAPASSAAPAASGSGGSALAGVGPWAALAAVIAVNEHNAKKKDGVRSENDREYWEHMLGGKVMEQDAHKRWNNLPDKWFGDENDSMGLGGHMKFDGNLFSGDFSNAWKNFKEDDVGAKLFKKLGNIF